MADFNGEPLVAQSARIGDQVAETSGETYAADVNSVEQTLDASVDPLISAASSVAPAEIAPANGATADPGQDAPSPDMPSPDMAISLENSTAQNCKELEQSVASIPNKPIPSDPIPHASDEIVNSTAGVVPSFPTSLRTVSNETLGYFKRSAWSRFDLVESLLKARTPGSMVQIYAEFAKSSCSDFIAHSAKIRGIYVALAQDAYKSAAAVRGDSKPSQV